MGGHIPIVPPTPEQVIRSLERDLRGRRSWLPWRRRRAYQACLTLIWLRERALDADLARRQTKQEPPQELRWDPVELVDGTGRRYIIPGSPTKEERWKQQIRTR